MESFKSGSPALFPRRNIPPSKIATSAEDGPWYEFVSSRLESISLAAKGVEKNQRIVSAPAIIITDAYRLPIRLSAIPPNISKILRPRG
jgi:hypothetical protein